MGFFDRNRRSLEKDGIDPSRLPPGQYRTVRFPVLHVGAVPTYDMTRWDFRIDGLVANPVTLTWDDLRALPVTTVTCDIHCVTKWSMFDTVWEGVRVRDVLAAAGGVLPGASHVLQHAEGGYTTNTPLADVVADDVLLAWSFGGEPLSAEHGGPLRLMLPSLYFWKSAKWIRRLEVLDHDVSGFWEVNGYHDYGDPFREQRFRDSPVQRRRVTG